MIFADTSFWVALQVPRDGHHASARSLLERYGSASLLTSNQVRGETLTFIRRRAGQRAAVAFLDALDRSARVRVEFVDSKMDLAAIGWLRRHDEREYSFVDATSFALMRSFRIREALAFDGDFSSAGFLELRP